MKTFETKNEQIKQPSVAKTIGSVLSNTCILFTVLAMAILATQLFGNNDLISPLRFFLLFPFSLCVSLSNLIFKARSINTFFKLFIHFAALSASFYLCLCTTLKNVKPVILVIILGVLYIIIATPIVIILKSIKKKSEPKPEYVSMFKGASERSSSRRKENI